MRQRFPLGDEGRQVNEVFWGVSTGLLAKDAGAALGAAHAIYHLQGRGRLGRLGLLGPRLYDPVAVYQKSAKQAQLAVKSNRVSTRVRAPVETRLRLRSCAEFGTKNAPPRSIVFSLRALQWRVFL